MENRTKRIAFCGVLCALACALTIFPKVPIGGGYVHFGDCVIYIASILLGPVEGAVVGAIGHSLADLFSGFPIFCIPTFIIKGIMGFVIGKLLHEHIDTKHFIIAAGASLLIVTVGYFIAEIPLLGYKTALISLISSPIQWAMSMAASALLLPPLIKNRKKLGF